MGKSEYNSEKGRKAGFIFITTCQDLFIKPLLTLKLSKMSLSQDIALLRSDVDEIRSLINLAKSERVKNFLSIELRRWETRLADMLENEKKSKNTSEPSVPTTKPTTQTPRTYDVHVKNYSWEESDNFVKIYLTGLEGAKDLDKDAFELQVEQSSLFFKVKDFKGKNMVFNIKETAGKIDVEKSYYKAKSDMVVIFLKKQNTAVKWSHLKKVDKEAADKPKMNPPKPDDNADPSASLMNMMKQMYEEGDDDMKRTINKAWTESNSKEILNLINLIFEEIL